MWLVTTLRLVVLFGLLTLNSNHDETRRIGKDEPA